MNAPTPMELMLYADGELGAEDARRVASWLEGSEAGRRAGRSLQVTGEMVRLHAEATAAPVDVVPSVMEALGQAEPTGAPADPHPRRRGGRRLHAAWTAAVTGLAAAAAVALFVMTRPDTPPELTQGSGAAPEGTVGAAGSGLGSGRGAPGEEPAGASIAALDPGASGATLFVVQAGSVSTPVVWLVDDGDETGDRIEPL